MVRKYHEILKEALALPFEERATLIDVLLESLDQPDEEMKNLWRKEVDDRIAAYRAGKMRAISLNEVLSKRFEKEDRQCQPRP